MRCMCSGKSKSYMVTTVKTPTQSKVSIQKVVNNSVPNGIAVSESDATQHYREASTTTTTTPVTNGVETTPTTTAVTQLHDHQNDSVTRYQDTAKTVAKEFTSIPTSKSLTPEETLTTKSKAPQPTTSGGEVISHKTSEIHMASSENTSIAESSYKSVNATQETSINTSSTETASKDKTSLLMVHSPNTISRTLSENLTNAATTTTTTPVKNSVEKTHHTTCAVIQIHDNHSDSATGYQDTPKTAAQEFTSISTPKISTPEGTLTKKSKAPQPTTSGDEVISHMASSERTSVTESSYKSVNVTQETSIQTSSTITASKSETSLLMVQSPSDTISRPSSVASTAELSSASTEKLIDVRKESVGELLAGSNRSSASLEENEARRRSGVQVSVPTGPEVTGEEEMPIFKKSPEDEEKIKKAIEKNEFLSKILSGKRLQDIINAMQLKNVIAKQKLIKQGEKGSEMFVSREGTYKILIKGKEVGQFNDTRVFGELAILYNAKRLASIQAVTAGKVWVLDRHVYQKIVISSNLKEQDENLRFLQNVESLNVVDVELLRQVSNLLKPEFFVAGTVIIRQGDKGDKFYIIRAGTVTISKTGEGVLGKLGRGQCFGEMALQKEDTRQATVTAEAPGVECLTLTRADFINHFGDVEIPKIEVKKTSFKDDAPLEYQDVKLEDLKIIKTLGVGGFGRVELVQHKKKKDLIFALKYLKKIDIVYQNQQEHVYNEKLIQTNSRSPFIVRMYRTYKDNKYVYFLMESCLGGDLFSLLHKQKGKRFEEKDARFLSACVLEALEHLHSKGVVYRDLKPENLLIDKHGYLKLTDFGFAKKMPARGKTFTFAGTPEYVAPEIVLNRGHDKAVDYWAFGAFIFELLTGRTPFRTGDSSHMRTYNKILNGIDNVNFPTYMNPKARNLIEKLCRPVPSERLGMQRGGTRDIKAHKWYQGFDWVKFQQGQIPSPFKPKLRDLTDTSNFDLFKQDKDYPPDETSGWDIHF